MTKSVLEMMKLAEKKEEDLRIESGAKEWRRAARRALLANAARGTAVGDALFKRVLKHQAIGGALGAIPGAYTGAVMHGTRGALAGALTGGLMGAAMGGEYALHTGKKKILADHGIYGSSYIPGLPIGPVRVDYITPEAKRLYVHKKYRGGGYTDRYTLRQKTIERDSRNNAKTASVLDAVVVGPENVAEQEQGQEGNWLSRNKKKLLIGLGGTAALGAGAYGLYRLKSKSKKNSPLMLSPAVYRALPR